jgi:hypothetical protein
MGNRTKYLQHQTLDSHGVSPWQGVFTNRVMVSRAAIIKQFFFFARKADVGLQVSTAALPVLQTERRAAEILAYLNDWVSRKESEGSSIEVCDVT